MTPSQPPCPRRRGSLPLAALLAAAVACLGGLHPLAAQKPESAKIVPATPAPPADNPPADQGQGGQAPAQQQGGQTSSPQQGGGQAPAQQQAPAQPSGGSQAPADQAPAPPQAPAAPAPAPPAPAAPAPAAPAPAAPAPAAPAPAAPAPAAPAPAAPAPQAPAASAPAAAPAQPGGGAPAVQSDAAASWQVKAQPAAPSQRTAPPVPAAPAGRGGGAAAAGAAATSPVSLFGEQIEVRVVNVEAVVTDKSGNRVPDLTPQDFRLKVDGKVTKIDYFSEVRGGQAIAVAPGSGSETIPGLPDLVPGSPVGTSYLVFIDDFFSIASNRNDVLKSLKDDLSRLGPEDRMAIVAYDGRRLNMLSSWSSSARDLARAIQIEVGNPAHGLDRVAELRQFEHLRTGGGGSGGSGTASDVMTGSQSGFSRTTLSVPEEAFVQELGAQVDQMVGAAVSTLRAFASPPGRKVMLILSGGWPYSPADYVVNNINRPITMSGLPNGDHMLKPLVDTANRLGYTLYPVDVPGFETQAATAQTDFQGPSLSTLFGMREQEHEGTLMFLAKETGGKALLNSLRIASLEHVEADTRSYYWLGFTPSWQGNDKSHDVRLEVLRKGLEVRTRDSFLDRSRKAEISMMVESAMLFGAPPGSATMPVQLGAPVKTRRGQMEVAVTLAIPTESFVTVPLNGKYASELELRIAAMDDHGERSDVPVVPLTLSSDRQPLPGHFVRYQTKLTLRRTNQHLIFAVFDPLSNKITTAETDVKAD